MSIRVDVEEAKRRFAELVTEAEAGERVVITRDGTPVGGLIRYEPRTGQRPCRGTAKGRMWISDDFDEPDKEFIQEFEKSAESDRP